MNPCFNGNTRLHLGVRRSRTVELSGQLNDGRGPPLIMSSTSIAKESRSLMNLRAWFGEENRKWKQNHSRMRICTRFLVSRWM